MGLPLRIVRGTALLLGAVLVASCSNGGPATAPGATTTTTVSGFGFEAPTSLPPGAGPASGATAGHGSGASTVPVPVGAPTTRKGATTSTTTTAAANTTTTVPPGLPAEKCPEAKTCRRHGYVPFPPARWPIGPDGRATVHYNVYPYGSQTQLSVDQITRAIAAAFATWQRAAPTLQFVYDGITSSPPVGGDGINTVGFSPTHIFAGVDFEGDRMTEADMFLGTAPYVWHPCEERDNSCTPARDEGRFDLQAITTHEVGHWLGLRDMDDYELERELTMFPGEEIAATTDRHWVTLALGDVLGVRSLYPCSCPLPPVYSP